MMMNNLKELVEKIVDYTSTWTITENEWYWNIECVRKPNNVEDKEITWEEFETAVREEILYDLVFKDGVCLCNQMENDACNYSAEYDGESNYNLFIQESKALEKEVQKYIKDFKVRRYDNNGEEIK